MDYIKVYREWLYDGIVNEYSRNDLLCIQNNDSEIKERFFKNLKFGTGGLRGIIGAGTNRINIYTIRKATQGLADYIISSKANENTSSVVIAYDSRHFSELFAEEAALVLAGNQIKTYVFDSLRPTPVLSFAVRHLNCDAGIVITASHNPPEYNGYKVYGSDGGQITLKMANAITNKIDEIDMFHDVKTCIKEDAIEREMLTYIGEDVDREYLLRVIELSINSNKYGGRSDFKIVYTPLHGTGLVPITKALSLLGYNDVHIVESQKEPDGNFPTVTSPNPEDREALKEGIKLAKKIGAEIVLGTDPDSDRVGVAIRSKNDDYVLLTGNQIGALLTQYLVTNKKDLNSKDAVIKTIVTSELGANIAKSYGATVFDTLTGFKYIGEKIKEFEENKDYNFLFGYEESYGYLSGTFVRDKDAVISSVLIVEMVSYYKFNGTTLLEEMDKIYQKYGYFTDILESYPFKGADGLKKIESIVDKFRNIKVLKYEFPDISIIEDYKSQKRYDINTSIIDIIELPSSNVIKVFFTDGSWFALRPSGTESKLKIYYSAWGKTLIMSNNKINRMKKTVEKLFTGTAVN